MAVISGIIKFFTSHIKKISLQVALLIIIFIVCCCVLFAIADMIFEDKNLGFDNYIFSLIDPYHNGVNTRWMNFITFFGSQIFLLPANLILIGIFLFFKKNWRHSVQIASVSITSTAVLFLLKSTLQRQRPLLPFITKAHGYSFPSGHTFTSIVFFGMLAYIGFKTIENTFLKWSIIIFLFVFALLVGFSRIYLKLHYTSDVIAGFCLGFIWLLLARWLLIKTEKMPGQHSGMSDQPDHL